MTQFSKIIYCFQNSLKIGNWKLKTYCKLKIENWKFERAPYGLDKF